MRVTFLNTCWNNDKVLIWKTMKTTQSHSSQLLYFQAIFMGWIEQVLWRAYNCGSFMIANNRGLQWDGSDSSRFSRHLSPPLPVAVSKGISVGIGTPTWGIWETYYYCFHSFPGAASGRHGLFQDTCSHSRAKTQSHSLQTDQWPSVIETAIHSNWYFHHICYPQRGN